MSEVIRIDPKIEGSPDNIEQLSNIRWCYYLFKCTNYARRKGVDWQDIKSEYINRLTGHKFGDMPIILKSTMPLFSNLTTPEYDEIPEHVVYNPEFLTAANAEEDFENQKHFILGVDPRSITHDTFQQKIIHMQCFGQIYLHLLCRILSLSTQIEKQQQWSSIHIMLGWQQR